MRLPAKVTLSLVWVAVQCAFGDDRPAAEAHPERVLANLRLPSGLTSPNDLARRSGDDDTVAVMVELADAPAVVVYAAERARAPLGEDAKSSDKAAIAAARSRLATIERAQTEVLGALGRLNGKLLYRTQRAYNGIAAQVRSRDLPQIRRLPGVKAVHVLVPKRPGNWNSVPFIGSPAAWKKGLGFTGAGIRIGVIDTGIDYLHANFLGPGAAANYFGLNPNDSNTWDVFTAVDANYPGLKVAGGYDFAGDFCDGLNFPNPDANPMDCSGHGTHVAGTIGGYGVETAGDTFTGPYNASTPFASLEIGPGVAPEAKLYALRVFGCQGSTNLVTQALDWAIDPDGDANFSDHLDVVNMSLGSDYGGPEDPGGEEPRHQPRLWGQHLLPGGPGRPPAVSGAVDAHVQLAALQTVGALTKSCRRTSVSTRPSPIFPACSRRSREALRSSSPGAAGRWRGWCRSRVRCGVPGA